MYTEWPALAGACPLQRLLVLICICQPDHFPVTLSISCVCVCACVYSLCLHSSPRSRWTRFPQASEPMTPCRTSPAQSSTHWNRTPSSTSGKHLSMRQLCEELSNTQQWDSFRSVSVSLITFQWLSIAVIRWASVCASARFQPVRNYSHSE